MSYTDSTLHADHAPCKRILSGGCGSGDIMFVEHGVALVMLQVEGGRTMKLRVFDSNYLSHVDRFWNTLLPKMAPYLYHRGGPILMTQVPVPCRPHLAASYHWWQTLAASSFGSSCFCRVDFQVAHISANCSPACRAPEDDASC
jgi:hypothetical protein